MVLISTSDSSAIRSLFWHKEQRCGDWHPKAGIYRAQIND